MSQSTSQRQATLQLASGPTGQTLTAKVPLDLSDQEFGKVAVSAYALIHKLTGCNCLSGRISFVVQDNFADVINVSLGGT